MQLQSCYILLHEKVFFLFFKNSQLLDSFAERNTSWNFKFTILVALRRTESKRTSKYNGLLSACIFLKNFQEIFWEPKLNHIRSKAKSFSEKKVIKAWHWNQNVFKWYQLHDWLPQQTSWNYTTRCGIFTENKSSSLPMLDNPSQTKETSKTLKYYKWL